MSEPRSHAGPIVALVLGAAIVAAGYFLYGMETERDEASSVFAPLLGLGAMGLGTIVAIVGFVKLAGRGPKI